MNEFRPVVSLAEVPDGRGITTRVGGRMVAVFNFGGEILAMDGKCPHKGGPLGDGYCENGKAFCPLHGWQFDVRTGACVDFPDKSVATYPARVVDGMIEVAF